jgi:O-antigen/teichoic acid export membrane protein
MIAWQKLLSSSALIFAARMSGAFMMFAAQAFLARSLGQVMLGEFLVVLAGVNIAAMILPLGFQTIGSYFAAEYAARGQRNSLIRFVLQGVLQICVMFCLLLLLKPSIFALLGNKGLRLDTLWFPALTMAFASALIFMSGSTLVALKRPLVGLAAETLFRPTIIAISILGAIAGYAVGSSNADALTSMFSTMAILYGLVALIHGATAFLFVRRVPNHQPRKSGEYRRWWRFAFPWVLISLATDFYFDLDLLHLSQLLSPDDLAVFGVTVRIFILTSFAVTAVYTVIMPHVFDAEANNNRSEFMQRISNANMAAFGMSVVLIVGLAVLGRFALGIFGPDFERGAIALVIISLVLLVRSFLGPAALVLSLHDRPYAPLPAAFIGLVLLFGLNHLIVPNYGLVGAAVAALVALTIWSLVLWHTARKITGVDVSMLPRLRAVMGRR